MLRMAAAFMPPSFRSRDPTGASTRYVLTATHGAREYLMTLAMECTAIARVNQRLTLCAAPLCSQVDEDDGRGERSYVPLAKWRKLPPSPREPRAEPAGKDDGRGRRTHQEPHHTQSGAQIPACVQCSAQITALYCRRTPAAGEVGEATRAASREAWGTARRQLPF